MIKKLFALMLFATMSLCGCESTTDKNTETTIDSIETTVENTQSLNANITPTEANYNITLDAVYNEEENSVTMTITNLTTNTVVIPGISYACYKLENGEYTYTDRFNYYYGTRKHILPIEGYNVFEESFSNGVNGDSSEMNLPKGDYLVKLNVEVYDDYEIKEFEDLDNVVDDTNYDQYVEQEIAAYFTI